jgi:hypothetical protein
VTIFFNQFLIVEKTIKWNTIVFVTGMQSHT